MKENPALFVPAAFVSHPEVIVTHICLATSTFLRVVTLRCVGLRSSLFLFFFLKGDAVRFNGRPFVREIQKQRRPRKTFAGIEFRNKTVSSELTHSSRGRI